MMANSPELKKAIGLPQATALVVGTIIGASIFVQPSEITGRVPSISGIFLVWLLCGILTLFGALVCAELASIFTRSGGVYIYLKEAFSPALGFLWGWAMFWTVHSGIIAAIALICARYFAFFKPLGEMGIKSMAIVVIMLLSAINYIGVKQGATLQAVFTLGKLFAIFVILVFGFTLGSRLPTHFYSSQPMRMMPNYHEFALALVAGLFAFGGWHMVTYSAEETIRSRNTIPRALILGTVIVTICYIALNAVYLYILPLEKVASSTRIAADAADVLLGFGGGATLSALVIFSTFGALSGIILAGPRVYFSMARDGLLFRWLGQIHPKFRTPHRAILLQAVWSGFLVLNDTYRALFTRVVYTEWIFFGLMAIGLILLRHKPGLHRNYRIWGYPMVPAIFALAAFAIGLYQVVSGGTESLSGLLLVLTGLPIYYLWARRPLNKETAS